MPSLHGYRDRLRQSFVHDENDEYVCAVARAAWTSKEWSTEAISLPMPPPKRLRAWFARFKRDAMQREEPDIAPAFARFR